MKKIEFIDRDFDNMMFPIHHYMDGVNLLRYPEFKLLKDYGDLFTAPIDGIELDRVIRYIMLMYDINSPIHTISIFDQHMRKMTAARYAYFKADENGFYSDEIIGITMGKNERVNRMIVRFSLLFYLPQYTKLIALMQAYHKKMIILVKGEHDNNVLKMVNEIEVEMKQIITGIFSGDMSLDQARTLYLVVDEDQLDLSPEGVAKRRKEGSMIVDIDPQKLRRSINLRS